MDNTPAIVTGDQCLRGAPDVVPSTMRLLGFPLTPRERFNR